MGSPGYRLGSASCRLWPHGAESGLVMATPIEHDLFLAPGELLLASTGVTAALRPGPVRITQEVLGRASPVGMARAIERRLKRFMRGSEFAERVERPAFDYDEICDLLPQMVNEARNVENVAGFETQHLADEYAGVLGVAVGYIQREIPDQVAAPVIGGQRLTASDYEIASFRRKYSVIDHPLLLLDDLAAGWLVDDQVMAMKTVYPAIYNAIRGSVMAALVDAAGTKKTWRLPYDKDLQMQVLLQQSTMDGRLHDELLKRWEEKRQEESGQTKQSAAAAPKRTGIGDPSTQNERLEAK
jgi:hypothetical protein